MLYDKWSVFSFYNKQYEAETSFNLRMNNH